MEKETIDARSGHGKDDQKRRENRTDCQTRAESASYAYQPTCPANTPTGSAHTPTGSAHTPTGPAHTPTGPAPVSVRPTAAIAATTATTVSTKDATTAAAAVPVAVGATATATATTTTSSQRSIRVQPYQAQLSPRQAAACLGQVVPPSPARRYRAKTAKSLGILQIVLAIVSLVLGIITAAIGAWGAAIGVPIWGGICFYLPAGILGVLSTKPTNMQNCVITSCMTMSILSSLAAGTSFIMSCIAATSEYDYYSYYPVLNVGNTIMDAILAFVAFTEVLVAITQSAFCCKYRCACCNKPNQAVQVTTPVRYASPHTHNMQPPMPYQHQQRQQQQFTMLQQRQVPAYRAQGIVPLQSAPGDTQPAHPNSVSDYLRSPDESHANEPELPPAYSDSPPPSYSLSTGYM
ncbi:uncharacterized protein LOC119725132 [Patiria miniata]|uniref:Uncharacterized protein n=1 Tax=Patiria miniata TaxID=46514 RepID=A0A913ZMZ3_PATMI|nr:uncharacterized protein LOC119725132 [Patiria miniata]